MKGSGLREMGRLEVHHQALKKGDPHEEVVGEQESHIHHHQDQEEEEEEVDVMKMMMVGASHDGGGKTKMIVLGPVVAVDFIKVGVRMTRMTTFLNGTRLLLCC